jgi:hypothetical protein
MKRDLELVRKILLAAEDRTTDTGWLILEIEGHTPEEISYHVRLLHEAGLLQAENLTDATGALWAPKRLTWEGHEFLDAARNDTVWNKTKDVVRDKGGSVPFEVLKELVVKIAASFFGLGE